MTSLKWTSLGGQWMNHCLWMLAAEKGGEFPSKPAIQATLNKYAPDSAVVRHGGSSLQIRMHVITEQVARDAIAKDLLAAMTLPA